MNINKLIQSVGLILNKTEGCENYTKLIKLLYLADRESFDKTGYTITGDSYVSMKNGPVLSVLLDLIHGNGAPELQTKWDSRFVTDGYDLRQICSVIPTGELSESEIETILSVEKKFHFNSYSYMIDYTHKNCPEWEDTDSSISITMEKLMDTLNFSKEERKFLNSEEKVYANEKERLSAIPDFLPKGYKVVDA